MKQILLESIHLNLIKSSFRIKIQQWNYDHKTSKQKFWLKKLSFSKIQSAFPHTPFKTQCSTIIIISSSFFKIFNWFFVIFKVCCCSFDASINTCVVVWWCVDVYPYDYNFKYPLRLLLCLHIWCDLNLLMWLQI